MRKVLQTELGVKPVVCTSFFALQRESGQGFGGVLNKYRIRVPVLSAFRAPGINWLPPQGLLRTPGEILMRDFSKFILSSDKELRRDAVVLRNTCSFKGRPGLKNYNTNTGYKKLLNKKT